MLDDPLGFIGDIFAEKIRQKFFQAWIRFLFQMGMSALITLCFVWGLTGLSALAAGASGSTAFFTGLFSALVMVGIVVTHWFRTSEVTKGMRIVIPGEEAEKEMAANLQVIERK